MCYRALLCCCLSYTVRLDTIAAATETSSFLILAVVLSRDYCHPDILCIFNLSWRLYISLNVYINKMASAAEQDGELPMANIENPLETDVLCGRGGAALRHPGNQTYRTLVQLNKALYITCPKVEKLKVSKSIVHAIREQNGRFLEKDAKTSAWFDIGDKKAIEKTSQALREGQPELKKKIAEIGSSAVLMESQQLPSQYRASDSGSIHSSFDSPDLTNLTAPATFMASSAAMAQHQFVQTGLPSASLGDVPSESMANVSADHQVIESAAEMPQPASLHHLMSTSLRLTDNHEDSNPTRFGPSIAQRGSLIEKELGVEAASSRTLMSDFSDFGMKDSVLSLGTSERDPSAQLSAFCDDLDSYQEKPRALPSDVESRRKLFARMKFNRDGRSGRASGRMANASLQSIGDGMPEIHMLESSVSLYSNCSSIGENNGVAESGKSHMRCDSDTSDVNSMISDLSKKIGNVSTRSIAMSELSNLDELDPPDISDRHSNATSPQPMPPYPMDFE